MARGDKQKADIEFKLMILGLKFEKEVAAIPGRRFKFDWAIKDWMIAIEYEGLMSKKSRHTTIGGYSKDTEKYNLAQINGWIVLRYTALTVHQMSDQIAEAMAYRKMRLPDT